MTGGAAGTGATGRVLVDPPDASGKGSVGGWDGLPRVTRVSEFARIAPLGTEDLVGIAVEGGPDAVHAWNQLVERHVRLVWKVVRSFGLPHEAAWEAYQGTWLRAVEQLDSLRERARFASWLTTIARREALAVIRTRGRTVPTASLADGMAPDSEPGDRLQRADVAEAVRKGLAYLSEPCRDLLRLLSADPPVPYDEIGRLLHLRHGSIGPTRRRCLEKLRATPPMVKLLSHD